MAGGRYWTMKELKRLEAFPKNKKGWVYRAAEEFNRTPDAISCACYGYGLGGYYRRWSTTDIQRLIDWPKDNHGWVTECAKAFNRSIYAIEYKCRRLKIPCPFMGKPNSGFWTEAKLKRLRVAHGEGYGIDQLKTIFLCGSLQISIGLRKAQLSYHHQWTPEQLEAARTWTSSCGETRLETARRLGVPALRFSSMIASFRRQARYGKHRRKVRSPASTSTTPNELQPRLSMQGKGF